MIASSAIVPVVLMVVIGHADLAESRCMDRQKQRALNVAGRVNKEIQLPTLTESQSKRLTHGLIDVVTV